MRSKIDYLSTKKILKGKEEIVLASSRDDALMHRDEPTTLTTQHMLAREENSSYYRKIDTNSCR